jgi:hypothetical protein
MLSPDLVRSALLQYAEDKHDWPSFSAYLESYDFPIGHIFEVPGLGNVKVVAGDNYSSHKNYDNWHEDIFVVFEIDRILYKASGTYTSYIGAEWESQLKIVQPVFKQTINYEEV